MELCPKGKPIENLALRCFRNNDLESTVFKATIQCKLSYPQLLFLRYIQFDYASGMRHHQIQGLCQRFYKKKWYYRSQILSETMIVDRYKNVGRPEWSMDSVTTSKKKVLCN